MAIKHSLNNKMKLVTINFQKGISLNKMITRLCDAHSASSALISNQKPRGKVATYHSDGRGCGYSCPNDQDGLKVNISDPKRMWVWCQLLQYEPREAIDRLPTCDLLQHLAKYEKQNCQGSINNAPPNMPPRTEC